MVGLVAGGEDWLRPRPNRAGLVRDALLAAAMTLAGVLGVELLRSTASGQAINGHVTETYLWTVALIVPLALRRVLPEVVLVVCSVVFYGLGERVPVAALSLVVQVSLFMAIYAGWAWSRHRRRLTVLSALVVVGMFLWLAQLIATAPPEQATGPIPSGVAGAVLTLALNAGYFFGAIAWGQASYRDAHRRHLLREQTAALRREQRLNAERAVAEDRMRIARDLHDAVAHHVTGIGVQASAARHVLDRDPAGSRRALTAIEDSSRAAVREMHQIVGLLRDESAAASTTSPSLAALDTLAGCAPGGPGQDPGRPGDRLEVSFRRVGEPFGVPPSVETSVFRTAQEALTNVRRHSTARTAEMVLRFLDTEQRAVEVEVLDAGSPRGAGHPTGSTTGIPPGPEGRHGFGLQGVRERAALHGAAVDIGPRPDGGFRVRVRFPVGP